MTLAVWPTAQLRSVSTRIGSGITPRGGASVYRAIGRPFVRSQNIGWGELRLDDIAFIDEATHSTFTASEIRAGDVLLNITGASIGRSAVAGQELDGGNVNQHVCEIRLDRRRMDSVFVNAFLLSRQGQEQIDAFQAGGNRQGLNFQQVGSITVPAPSLADQVRIGSILMDQRKLIASLERLIVKKQAIKQGMTQQLLTGRTRLPGFRAPWRILQLLDLVSIRNGQVDPRQPEYRDLPLIAPDHVESATGRLLKVETAKAQGAISGKYFAAPGDIIYSKIRPYLQKAVRVECPVLCSADMYPLTPKTSIDGAFVLHTLLSEQFTKFVTSVSARSGIPKVNRAELAEFALAVPDFSEQQAISAALDQADSQILTLETLLAKKKAIKQGMMQELLTGRTRLPVKEGAA